jgi:hypothetical protein
VCSPKNKSQLASPSVIEEETANKRNPQRHTENDRNVGFVWTEKYFRLSQFFVRVLWFASWGGGPLCTGWSDRDADVTLNGKVGPRNSIA